MRLSDQGSSGSSESLKELRRFPPMVEESAQRFKGFIDAVFRQFQKTGAKRGTGKMGGDHGTGLRRTKQLFLRISYRVASMLKKTQFDMPSWTSVRRS